MKKIVWPHLPNVVPRADLDLIESWVPRGARVLDLGCGDGALLKRLATYRQARGYGVDIDDTNVLRCLQQGVDVIQQNLEGGLALFDDLAFDAVILSQTLQAMHHVEHILREMGRVATEGIVSFPNFGHWYHLWSIARGRMPVSRQMPYQWFDTPNIHLCTVSDFEALAARLRYTITGKALFHHGRRVRAFGNLRSTLAVFRFRKN